MAWYYEHTSTPTLFHEEYVVPLRITHKMWNKMENISQQYLFIRRELEWGGMYTMTSHTIVAFSFFFFFLHFYKLYTLHTCIALLLKLIKTLVMQDSKIKMV